MEEKKQKKSYSFKLKKTDSPLIKEFIENQSNFSETIRFLLYKYILENKSTEDISYKFNELLFGNVIIEENSNKKPTLSDEISSDKVEPIESIEPIKKEDVQKEDLNEDDIPSCYK